MSSKLLLFVPQINCIDTFMIVPSPRHISEYIVVGMQVSIGIFGSDA